MATRKDHNADKQSIGFGEYIVTCVWCENKFEATRYDAAFCSGRCRVAHHRHAGKIERQRQKFDEMLTELIERLPRAMPKSGSPTFDLLQHAQKRITSALATVESSPVTTGSRDTSTITELQNELSENDHV